MSNPRPRSWYAVPQPYTYQAPGQQAPLAPGAPDFPPYPAAAAERPAAAGSLYDANYQNYQPRSVVHEHGGYPHSQTTMPDMVNMRLANSSGSSAFPAAMDVGWMPTHHQITQLELEPDPKTYSDEPSSMLQSPSMELPVRARSPKLGGHTSSGAVSQEPSFQAGPQLADLSRVRSPQPRRNTVPSPIPQSNFNVNDTFAASTSRRPLPAPPGQHNIIPAHDSGQALPQTLIHSVTPSPSLSRSPSAASTSSDPSIGSQRRRPLPQVPGLPKVPERSSASDNASHSSRPASYSQAQMAAASELKQQSTHLYQSASEQPAHVRDARQRVQQGADRARQNAQSSVNLPIVANEHSGGQIPAVSAGPPTISVPVFAFDAPDEPSSSSGPAISISIAPPSPSLKATSSDYFAAHLEDEHVPLPTSSVPMATSTKAYATACPKCERPVLYGRTVNAMGQRWHPDCFVCEQCDTKLEHMEFFTKDGRPYCHVDYHELFSIRCNHCKTPIVDESYITIDDTILGKRTYHELHFFCANCGDPFLDPKAQGATDAEEAHLAAKPFTVHNGYPYCEACNLKLHRPKCSSCKKPIPGDVLKALGKDWCEDCFVCTSCNQPFADGTFAVHHGLPYCELCLKRRLHASR